MHKLFATALLLAGPTAALAEEVTRTGAEALQWSARMTCGTTEANVVRYGFWEGRLYSRVPGERDRHLFDVMGVNTRTCARLTDPVRGEGFRSVSREVMFYLDPATGEVIDRWKNPWTGEEVEVVQVANDPVNMREPTFALRKDGTPLTVKLRQYDDTLVSASEAPLFYTNPLAGDFQDYVGGTYHAMEIFNIFYRTADFIGAKRPRIADSRLSWQRISKWMPWMKMGDRTGLMVFTTTGFSTFDAGKVPAKLWAIVDARYPQYRQPPPTDDARPNETTWTVFRKTIEARQQR